MNKFQHKVHTVLCDAHNCDVIAHGLCHELPKEVDSFIDKVFILGTVKASFTLSDGIKQSKILGCHSPLPQPM